MKASLLMLGLLAFAANAQAQSSSSSNHQVTQRSQAEQATAAWALFNVTGDALGLAEDYKDNEGIGNTTAGSYLNDLANDTRPLKDAARRLAGLLERNAPRWEIDNELRIIEERYLDTRSGNQKASTQLYVQGKPNEGYQIRTAYTKIRSRWVYLQGLLD
ncbi:MAG: hypothetical protein V4655_11215 [Bdellovibrionota bacterium]|nr:MAG: hypothetical protein EOP10_15270 [Pseudomonadota bacterium]